LKVGVLISGRGSNLQVLLESCADPAFPAEIGLVISNVADAHGLERARAAGVVTLVIDHKIFPSREAFDAEMDAALRAAGIELVCLAGFMRLLSAGFVEAWQGRMINIHPSLLPAFKGLRPHAQALAAGVKLHGCTVHYVTPALDDGPIVAQGAVPVLAGDTEEDLAARVLAVEHKLYPLALKVIAEGKAGSATPTASLINPPI
jgi:phosphoribosylglycinamide formyltransferase-1